MSCPYRLPTNVCPAVHDPPEDDFSLEEAVTNAWVIRHCGMGAIVDQLGAELLGLCSVGDVEQIRALFTPRFSTRTKFLLQCCVSVLIATLGFLLYKIVQSGEKTSTPSDSGQEAIDFLFQVFFSLLFCLWISCVFYGVAHFEPRILPTYKNEQNVTALHVAVTVNRVEVCSLLLEHGARLDVKDALGKTPVDHASQMGHKEIIKLFKDRDNGRLDEKKESKKSR